MQVQDLASTPPTSGGSTPVLALAKQAANQDAPPRARRLALNLLRRLLRFLDPELLQQIEAQFPALSGTLGEQEALPPEEQGAPEPRQPLEGTVLFHGRGRQSPTQRTSNGISTSRGNTQVSPGPESGPNVPA